MQCNVMHLSRMVLLFFACKDEELGKLGSVPDEEQSNHADRINARMLLLEISEKSNLTCLLPSMSVLLAEVSLV
jgi:hypothetical protein